MAPTQHVAGPPSASLALEMYGDFQCPYCVAAHPIIERVRAELDGELRFSFRHFPLRDAHPDAQLAAEAAEAAAAQGKFWEMYALLYDSRGRVGRADLSRYAVELGLDLERFERELGGGVHAQAVERDLEEGLAGGVSGTPAFFVNGIRHDGSFDRGSLLAALRRG